MNDQLRRLLQDDSDDDDPKPRDPYMMQIVDVGFIERTLRESWHIAKREYKLQNRHFYPISDWCVAEAFVHALAPQGICVTGHYCYDEAKTVYRNYLPRVEQRIIDLVSLSGLQNWLNCDVKIMVLNRDAIVARTVPAKKF